MGRADHILSASHLLLRIIEAIDKVEEDWNCNRISGSRPHHLAYASKKAIDDWFTIYSNSIKRTTEAIRKEKQKYTEL